MTATAQHDLFGDAERLESENKRLRAVIDQARAIAEDWRDNYMTLAMAGVVIITALDDDQTTLRDLLPGAREGLIR